MKKTDSNESINELWDSGVSEGQLRSFAKSFKKNKGADQDLYEKDPASLLFLCGNEVRRAVDAADLDDSLKLPETLKAVAKRPQFLHFHPTKSIASVFASFLAVRWRRAVSAAAFIVILGAIFYLSFMDNRETERETVTGRDLRKIQKYDNGIGREAAATDGQIAEGIETADAMGTGVSRSGIATNLVTDGRKVIHYKLNSGTEMIFITGLD